ncbi:MAG: hypothetical protein M1821_004587 [Bathelium mastoideum]|nr:MAG: hypothetical protein M1821_004587 [Bathelium mastoideum]
MLGLYRLGLPEEHLLGYDSDTDPDNAEFGNETFTLGDEGAGLPTISKSIVEGFATKDFYMGALGLTPHGINITNFTDPHPTPLQVLKNASRIPSLSWGYTAGAFNQDPPVFGSLTLGGYDTTRFISNDVSFDFGADYSRDLLVGVSAVTTNVTSIPLLNSGIYAFIDSLVTEIWLPLSVCEAFEQAFGLNWNETAQLYLLNDTVHDALIAKNPNVTFQLVSSSNSSNSNSVEIALPYSAFDLNTSIPIVSSSSRYFPLKRAENSTQYTLGRVFLQYAYVITDYERSTFSVYQAQFPSSGVSQNLVAILPPDTSNRRNLSAGAITGIVVGIVLLAGLCAFLPLFSLGIKKRRVNSNLGRSETTHTSEPRRNIPMHLEPELDAVATEKSEMDAEANRTELPDHTVYELPAPITAEH